jgi:hypothetical protein
MPTTSFSQLLRKQNAKDEEISGKPIFCPRDSMKVLSEKANNLKRNQRSRMEVS